MKITRRTQSILAGLWFMSCAGLTAGALVQAMGTPPVKGQREGEPIAVFIFILGFSLAGALWGSFLGPRVIGRTGGWSRFGLGGVLVAIMSLPTGLGFWCLGAVLTAVAEAPLGHHWFEVPVGFATMFVLSCIYTGVAIFEFWWFVPVLLAAGIVAGVLFPILVSIAEAVLSHRKSEPEPT
jgi:hypothetical protein